MLLELALRFGIPTASFLSQATMFTAKLMKAIELTTISLWKAVSMRNLLIESC